MLRRKTEHPGFVETPAPRRVRSRSRKSGVGRVKSEDSEVQDSASGGDDSTVEVATNKRGSRMSMAPGKEPLSNGHANGHANGYARANGHAESKKSIVDNGREEGKDPKIDYSGHFEFGGSWGTSALMLGFPTLMYYMWIGATYYDGHLPLPDKGQSMGDFIQEMGRTVYQGAYPSAKAWAMYWVFFVFEMAMYCLMPGVWSKGKPLPHEDGRRLDYYCSGMWSWWVTILTALTLHFTGIFRMYELIDEFGPFMSVAIISGFLVSIVAYVSAIYRGKQHRMSGYPIYDFFMGAELNPRMFGILDFKMFFEVRIPWYILFLTSLAATLRQYEQYGYVSGEMGFILMAHFIYANACSRGEQNIVPTWDMYYEKWGFMLIFWNMAGVPLSYCHCTLYLANHDPKEYAWNRYVLAAWYVTYIFTYWVWDTANSQKNRHRRKELGDNMNRWVFPQLPWQELDNPKLIRTEDGRTLLCDGWCKPTLLLRNS